MNDGLKIYICTGRGEGITNISAFDSALIQAGIANYNLLYLSSVIPKNSKVIVEKFISNEENYGNKLYVVMSRSDQIIAGKEAWAGLGWIQDEKGRGLFAEHRAESKDSVISLIEHSLESMKKSRNFKYGKVEYVIKGIKCHDKPVCAIAVAVYKSEDWQ